MLGSSAAETERSNTSGGVLDGTNNRTMARFIRGSAASRTQVKAALAGKFGADLLNSPDGATFVERTLFANECR
jgi:hypothetical protein